MSTDPYVTARIADRPRQKQNMPPGITLPPAEEWYNDRAGDFNAPQPEGTLLGRPGPNVGYALTLADRMKDRFELAPTEHLGDVVSVVAETAMKRAAHFGRAPVAADVEVAASVLGYLGGADATFVEIRAHAVHGAGHHYQERRRVVDAVPDDVMRLAPAALKAATLDAARTAIREALTSH